jgi:hypothetical protein
MATGQSSASSQPQSNVPQGGNAATNPQPTGAGAAAPATKRAKSTGPRKASPKVKALSEVRTFLIQQRGAALSGKTGVELAIERDRFDRMIDAVENLFPGGHAHNVPRETEAATNGNGGA